MELLLWTKNMQKELSKVTRATGAAADWYEDKHGFDAGRVCVQANYGKILQNDDNEYLCIKTAFFITRCHRVE
jgi:hypothetical protein